MVKMLMKGKVVSAREEHEDTKRKFSRLDSYLRRRWGHHGQVMSQFATILQGEVRRGWAERRNKHRTKIAHLDAREEVESQPRGKVDSGSRWHQVLRCRSSEEG